MGSGPLGFIRNEFGQQFFKLPPILDVAKDTVVENNVRQERSRRLVRILHLQLGVGGRQLILRRLVEVLLGEGGRQLLGIRSALTAFVSVV